MSLKLHGKNGKVVIGSQLVYGTKWTVELSRPTVDVSVFGDTWEVNVPGLHGASGSFDGLLDVEGDASLSAAMASGAVSIEVYADDTHLVASGKGYVDASASAAVDDLVRCSGRFKGTGPWTVF